MFEILVIISPFFKKEKGRSTKTGFFVVTFVSSPGMTRFMYQLVIFLPHFCDLLYKITNAWKVRL